jgi:hypothetical protein
MKIFQLICKIISASKRNNISDEVINKFVDDCQNKNLEEIDLIIKEYCEKNNIEI